MAANTHSTDLESTSSQYWSRAYNATLNMINSNFSVSCWIKPESLNPSSQRSTLVSMFDASSNHGWILQFGTNAGGNTFLPVTVFPSNSASPITVISAGTWYMVSCTFNTSTGLITVYVNGVSVGVGGATPGGPDDASGAGVFRIGYAGTDNYYDGLMDDVRVWSRELTALEIASLYADSCNFNNGANLVGWWEFNNNGNDSSGNGFTLTNNNTATFSTDVPYTCAGASLGRDGRFLSLCGVGM